ncbi:MAG: PKD domain-containing protein, partial [Methanomicrobiales archaeon]|nr:PKD domain-containing protein [Methanomicrobiales archaeon]
MRDRGVFHIILVIAFALILPACAVNAADNITTAATDLTATWVTLNEKVTHTKGESCDYGRGPCDYGGVKPLFIAVPKEGTSPLEIQFYDQSTGNPTTWQWDFGDGTGSIEQHPKHRYDRPGTYSVTLWIRNDFNSGVFVHHGYIIVLSDVPKKINVVTSLATGVTDTEATLHGEVTDIGLEPSVDVFFKYGTDPTLTIYLRVNAGTLSTAGMFNTGISGLTAGTTYHFQACAITATDEICGAILSVIPMETYPPTLTPTPTPTETITPTQTQTIAPTQTETITQTQTETITPT